MAFQIEANDINLIPI